MTFGLILCGSIPIRATAQTTLTGWDILGEYPEIPSNQRHNYFNMLGSWVSCYDDVTWELLDCPYTYQLVGVDDLSDPNIQNQLGYFPPLTPQQHFGGHSHDQMTHPFYWVASPTSPPITVKGGTYYFIAPTFVSGSSSYSTAQITFLAPETAGTIFESVDVGSPPNYICVGLCWTITDSLWHDTYFIGRQGLVQAPNPASNYLLVRTPDTAHVDADAIWLNPFTLAELDLIVDNYLDNTGNKLRLNDMSLPYGGIFDIDADQADADFPGMLGTWLYPHRGHRLGFAFDINRYDAGGAFINCHSSNNALAVAVKEFDDWWGNTPASTLPKQLLCEGTKGNLHINAFDPSTLSVIPQ